MKSGLKIAVALAVAVPLSGQCLFAAVTNAVPAADTLTNKNERLSYSIGMLVANDLKRLTAEVDANVIAEAIKDVLAGKATRLTDQQAQETFRAFQMELRAKRDADRMKLAAKNRAEGDKYLAQNKTRDGVKVSEVKLSETSMAELQYKVLSPGAGDPPKSGDTVVVNLKGSLIGGKEFENAMGRKSPVNHFPIGLREGIQMMKPGAKWEFFLPSTLAYGDFGYANGVEPGAAVLYEVELLHVESPQPLTSDIIMVPSAEQMKAGSNFVVIKPEDVPKYTKTNAPAPAKKP